MSTTMTKKDLVEALFEKVGLNKRESKQIVEVFFEEIRRTLERGEEVQVSNFGNFVLRDKNGRPGRNPRTNEMVPISPRRVITFHASNQLKKSVADTLSQKSWQG